MISLRGSSRDATSSTTSACWPVQGSRFGWYPRVALSRDSFASRMARAGRAWRLRCLSARRAIGGHRPGDQVPLVFERRGQRVTGTLRLVENPQVEIVRAEDVGQAFTEEQRRFRDAWLSSPAERVLNPSLR